MTSQWHIFDGEQAIQRPTKQLCVEWLFEGDHSQAKFSRTLIILTKVQKQKSVQSENML